MGNKKRIMRNNRFEYYMNALHYCIYKGSVWSTLKIEKQVYGLIGFLSVTFCFKKYYVKRFEKLHKDKALQEYLYGKEHGLSIGEAHHWFGYFYSCYPAFFSFILGGVYIRFCEKFDSWVIMALISIIIGLCYIPAYKAVFSKDKYLDYFKQFEKKDERWHKKWKCRTLLFCLGSIFFSLMGIGAMFCIFLL